MCRKSLPAMAAMHAWQWLAIMHRCCTCCWLQQLLAFLDWSPAISLLGVPLPPSSMLPPFPPASATRDTPLPFCPTPLPQRPPPPPPSLLARIPAYPAQQGSINGYVEQKGMQDVAPYHHILSHIVHKVVPFCRGCSGRMLVSLLGACLRPLQGQ